MRRTLQTIVLAMLVLAGLGAPASATHFRYGHLHWKARPDISSTTAEFTLINAFRRDGYQGSGADGHPVTGDVFNEFIGIDPALDFGDGTRTGRLDYVVIGYNVDGNWLLGRAIPDPSDPGLPMLHTYPGPGPWTAQVDTCCRIRESRNAPEGGYRILTTVNFDLPGSPVIAGLPIVPIGLPYVFLNGEVAVGDKHWRLARPEESGGLTPPPGITFAGNLLQWDTTGIPNGLYSVQAVLEDRDPATGAVMTQSAADFLLNLVGGGDLPPDFDQTPGLLPCGSVFDWVAGKHLEFSVRGVLHQSPSEGHLEVLDLPPGASMNPTLPRDTSGSDTGSTFGWTPNASQAGLHVVVFVFSQPATGLAAQCSAVINVKVDTDGDGLPDDWELHGYVHNGTRYFLPGANPDHKDIYLQVDFMETHEPNQWFVIDQVVGAFARAPNSLVHNPDGLDGVNLHVTLGSSAIPLDPNLGLTTLGPNGPEYDWGDFDTLKRARFPENLWRAHHYVIFAHNAARSSSGGYTSGLTRHDGTDSVVSLGDLPFGGTFTEQSATLMHELGHQLGLGHGGPVNPCHGCRENWKPDYLSVMNYSFQLHGLIHDTLAGFLDYSRFDMVPLDEADLNEGLGLLTTGTFIPFNYGTKWRSAPCDALWLNTPAVTWDVMGPINWNCNGIDPRIDPRILPRIEPSVRENINTEDGPSVSTLEAISDWDHLDFAQGIIGAGIEIAPAPSTSLVEEIDRDALASIPPPPPREIRARVARCVATLSWTLVGPPGESSYRLSRRIDGGDLVLLGTTGEAALTDPQVVAPDHAYEYQVEAVSTSGATSVPATVVVKRAVDQLDDMVALVHSQHLAPWLESGLVTGIELVRDSVARGNLAAACRQVTAFINKVQTLAGNQLTPAQAAVLTTAAEQVKGLVCCGS